MDFSDLPEKFWKRRSKKSKKKAIEAIKKDKKVFKNS
jgi:hypothetical protein